MTNYISWKAILQNPCEIIDETAFSASFQVVLHRLISRFSDDEIIGKYYSELSKFALEIVAEFPELLNHLNLKIQTYSHFCHTCIITDEEVDALSRYLHQSWLNKMTLTGVDPSEQLDSERSFHPDMIPFEVLTKERIRFYREIVYCIPLALKELKYELIKPNENDFIKSTITLSIARALHERYRYLMQNKHIQDEANNAYGKKLVISYTDLEFDQLDEEIKSSNIDSAFHISTKLLSIGYKLEKAELNEEPQLLKLDETDIETMSKLEHERWCWEKRLSGFIYGQCKTNKTHFCLVPYNELPEFEKSKDRDQVEQYPIIIKDIGYCIKSIDTENIQKISTYIHRKPSHIEKSMFLIEKQIDNLSKFVDTEITKIQLNDLISSTSKQLRSALLGIEYVRDGIRRSEQIQHNLLASKLFFKTCLPDSFILYKPLDIVCGDFYFVSKIHGQIILAAADCTGHGMPGAMLSMICYNFLDIAVNDHNLTDPVTILKFVFNKLENLIYRQTGFSASGDGMDIAICAFQPDTLLLSYVGVNRPLYLIQKGEIREFKSIRHLGNKTDIVNNCSLNSTRILLNKGDQFYIFTDGFTDQFGGDVIPTKKIGAKCFASLLIEYSDFSLPIQQEKLNEFIDTWRMQGKEDQTDDIMVIGVKA